MESGPSGLCSAHTLAAAANTGGLRAAGETDRRGSHHSVYESGLQLAKHRVRAADRQQNRGDRRHHGRCHGRATYYLELAGAYCAVLHAVLAL